MRDTTVIREVGMLNVPAEPGEIVRTPDGKIWIRHEPEIGGWEVIPAAAAARIEALTTERDTLRDRLDAGVWAVIEIDYDDYPVGEPLSYHWGEAAARAKMRTIRPMVAPHRYVVRKVDIAGAAPEGES